MRQSVGQLSFLCGSPLGVGMGLRQGDWLFRCRQPSHCEWWYWGHVLLDEWQQSSSRSVVIQDHEKSLSRLPTHTTKHPRLFNNWAHRIFSSCHQIFRRSLLSGLVHQFGRGYLKATTNRCPWHVQKSLYDCVFTYSSESCHIQNRFLKRSQKE